MDKRVVERKARVIVPPEEEGMSRKEMRTVSILLAALGVMIGLAVTYWIVLYAGGAL